MNIEKYQTFFRQSEPKTSLLALCTSFISLNSKSFQRLHNRSKIYQMKHSYFHALFNEIFVRITKLYGYRYLVKTQVHKKKYAPA